MASDSLITELVEFNPTRQIKRGTVAPFVDMAALLENQRDISYVAEREFTGGGARFQNGDTLFARITPCLENGKTAKVRSLADGVIAHGSTEFIVMAARVPAFDEDYVYYLARHPEFRSFAEARMEGTSGRQRVSWQALSEFTFSFPSPNQRKAIGSFLRKLDDKIALNRRINQTLEAMAQAIFKSWFVDFDPVKAKIAAKQAGRDPLRAAMSAISGKADAELDSLPLEQYKQLADTAALFPDELVESDFGDIPKGWAAQRVGNVLELVYGKALKSTDRQEGHVPVYGSGGITGYHNEPLVPHGSVIVGRKGTVGSLYWEDTPFFPIDTTYYVRPMAAPLTFCYYAMQTLGLEKMNTDAAVPGLNRENVYRLELVLPEPNVLERFDRDVLTLRKAMRANADSITTLACLRDTLLPKLLSGELTVVDSTAEAHE
jgi:type I restriction enzyme, S subunit